MEAHNLIDINAIDLLEKKFDVLFESDNGQVARKKSSLVDKNDCSYFNSLWNTYKENQDPLDLFNLVQAIINDSSYHKIPYNMQAYDVLLKLFKDIKNEIYTVIRKPHPNDEKTKTVIALLGKQFQYVKNVKLILKEIHKQYTMKERDLNPDQKEQTSYNTYCTVGGVIIGALVVGGLTFWFCPPAGITAIGINISKVGAVALASGAGGTTGFFVGKHFTVPIIDIIAATEALKNDLFQAVKIFMCINTDKLSNSTLTISF